MCKGAAVAAARRRAAAHFLRMPRVTRPRFEANAYPCALTLAPRPPARRQSSPDFLRCQS